MCQRSREREEGMQGMVGWRGESKEDNKGLWRWHRWARR